jgi:hypothetical protein
LNFEKAGALDKSKAIQRESFTEENPSNPEVEQIKIEIRSKLPTSDGKDHQKHIIYAHSN